MSGLEAWMKSAETTHRFYTQEVTVTPLHCLLLRSGTMPHCKTLLGTTVSDEIPYLVDFGLEVLSVLAAPCSAGYSQLQHGQDGQTR